MIDRTREHVNPQGLVAGIVVTVAGVSEALAVAREVSVPVSGNAKHAPASGRLASGASALPLNVLTSRQVDYMS